MDTATAQKAQPHRRPSGKPAGDLRRLLRLRVPVIVKLAQRRMKVGEVMRLTGGSIIEFAQAADAPLQLLVNNVVIGHGEVVKVGENFGLRISMVGTARDKVQALGGTPAAPAEPADDAPDALDDDDVAKAILDDMPDADAPKPDDA